jgi:hypothetical protein
MREEVPQRRTTQSDNEQEGYRHNGEKHGERRLRR